ncbi:hypothetical protein COCSUDRAFT_66534 [Coccomyxa subellipsoidea C-169]|uniref:RPA43 OB domain-containing protein n=1 Tax=Coccomyxa subellipsoidea (strain C-169) TaxID=574566 RepID=I0YV46_COCSC|nr:hypothetical protein COCSUDRAFT_66534 [Coccomyxa subellipsoidea C-169]EIE22265.1 hypothetical protein COCSUDRAFT_66534 [Coccomyxa subellipsoidea C-169]|eukprot:XP_005646809.1 hypothetical protein COCSUDRAFT_66534 [Coccomyxa subellipsoidea C-169]
MTGVKEQLNAWLLRWNHDLDGVMLSYSSPILESTQARIHPYFPYFHVDVAANVDLFSPAPGQLITGQVNKIGADYIGLLVLGIFNAAIGHQNIRAEFQHSAADNSWVSRRETSHRIEEGTNVIFTVHTVQNEGDFFSLTGKLDGAWTGAVGHTAPQIPDEEHRKKKKRKADAAQLRADATPQAQQQPANNMKRHKGAKSASAAKPAQPAAAVAAAAAVSSAERPKKEKKHKVYGNGVHDAVAAGPTRTSDAGPAVKKEPEEVPRSNAVPYIKTEAAAPGSESLEKKKKKKKRRDKDAHTEGPPPSSTATIKSEPKPNA